MKGFSLRNEATASRFICPSCSYRITANNAISRSRGPRLRSVSEENQRRFFNSHYRFQGPLTSRTASTYSSASAAVQDPAVEDASPAQGLTLTEVLQPQIPYVVLDPALPKETTYIKSAKDHVNDLLKEGQPDRVLHAFMAPRDLSSHMYSLPAPTFVEALRLLSPEYFVEPYKRLHRHFHYLVASSKGIVPLEDIFGRFSMDLSEIVHRRQEAGHKLGLAEYTHLLDCARAMGDGNMAKRLWHEMTWDGLQPNTECFNYYMETRLWDMAHFAREKYNVRTTERTLRKRSYDRRSFGYRGYKIGEDGVRDKVLELFDQMVARGLELDESTYIQLMMASSREGHIASVKNILKRAWNIEVDILVRQGEGQHLPPVTKCARSSPLHPTPRLLFAVAHMFGSNNDLPTALQLVDFISRQYGVAIPHYVWYEIFEWTFVLSKRSYSHHAADKRIGQIQKDALPKIYSSLTLTHKITPTMPIYNMLVKVAWERHSIYQMLDLMRKGRDLYYATQRKRTRLYQVIAERRKLLEHHGISTKRPDWQMQEEGLLADEHTDQSTAVQNGNGKTNETTNKGVSAHIRGFDDLMHEWKLLRLQASLDATFLERWVKLIFSRRKWTIPESEWFHQLVPQFIEEWRPFLPLNVHYYTARGIVEFDPKDFWPGGIRRRPERIIYPIEHRLNRAEKEAAKNSRDGSVSPSRLELLRAKSRQLQERRLEQASQPSSKRPARFSPGRTRMNGVN